LSDPSRLKTIRFYYADDRPLEKASSLSVDYRVRHNESLIIVETDEESSMERHALANTLALLASFATQKRRSLVSLPQDDDLMTLASLFTRHLYNLDDEGRLLKLGTVQAGLVLFSLEEAVPPQYQYNDEKDEQTDQHADEDYPPRNWTRA
uniref:FERM domain-containing protein n=1 Tax=Heligmosomoides polygyrus TaxID=6339 RepID=A0A183F9I4_HELPZ